MAIDRQAAQASYVDNTSRSADKLVRKYTARTDKLARASSDQAQKSFELAMSDPKVLKRRQAKLKGLSEEDLNRAMREKGASNYSVGTSAGVDKWAKNVDPYLSVIESEVNKLPPRTRNVDENIDRRVKPIAKALRAKKDSMV